MFANNSFLKGETIGKYPYIILNYGKIPPSLTTYTFGAEDNGEILPLGNILLLNSSKTPNCKFVKDSESKIIEIKAIENIKKDEELTLNYLS